MSCAAPAPAYLDLGMHVSWFARRCLAPIQESFLMVTLNSIAALTT